MSHSAALDRRMYLRTNREQIGERAYLDYSAVTPIDREVLEIMLPYFDRRYGNPSSIHADGRRSRAAIEESRSLIAALIGAKADEIIFTGSGTESDNLALIGCARANRERGNHLIISAIEHKAVLEAARVLSKEGFVVSVLPVNGAGMIDIEECLRLVTPRTILVSVMYVNNEIGTVLPLQKLSEALQKSHRDEFPLLHTDACQASNLFPIRPRELGVDLLSVNSSKLYGPLGAGFLYRRTGVNLSPLLVGGEQEKNLRAGTESVPTIVGFSRAFSKSQALREAEYARLASLSRYFADELLTRIPTATRNGDPLAQSPAIVHISVPDVEGESMLLKLDSAGISVSTGSACSAFDLRPSHVLLAIGQDPELVHGSIRFSLGRGTTKEELDRVLEVFPGIVRELLSLSALTTRHATATL